MTLNDYERPLCSTLLYVDFPDPDCVEVDEDKPINPEYNEDLPILYLVPSCSRPRSEDWPLHG